MDALRASPDLAAARAELDALAHGLGQALVLACVQRATLGTKHEPPKGFMDSYTLIGISFFADYTGTGSQDTMLGFIIALQGTATRRHLIVAWRVVARGTPTASSSLATIDRLEGVLRRQSLDIA